MLNPIQQTCRQIGIHVPGSYLPGKISDKWTLRDQVAAALRVVTERKEARANLSQADQLKMSDLATSVQAATALALANDLVLTRVKEDEYRLTSTDNRFNLLFYPKIQVYHSRGADKVEIDKNILITDDEEHWSVWSLVKAAIETRKASQVEEKKEKKEESDPSFERAQRIAVEHDMILERSGHNEFLLTFQKLECQMRLQPARQLWYNFASNEVRIPDELKLSFGNSPEWTVLSAVINIRDFARDNGLIVSEVVEEDVDESLDDILQMAEECEIAVTELSEGVYYMHGLHDTDWELKVSVEKQLWKNVGDHVLTIPELEPSLDAYGCWGLMSFLTALVTFLDDKYVEDRFPRQDIPGPEETSDTATDETDWLNEEITPTTRPLFEEVDVRLSGQMIDDLKHLAKEYECSFNELVTHVLTQELLSACRE